MSMGGIILQINDEETAKKLRSFIGQKGEAVHPTSLPSSDNSPPPKTVKKVNEEVLAATESFPLGSAWQHRDGAVYIIEGHTFDSERDAVLILYWPLDDNGRARDTVEAPWAHTLEDFSKPGRFTRVKLGQAWLPVA